jgi:hypothetical protein
MIHAVVMKRLIGLPLLMHIELLWRIRSFKNQGIKVGRFKKSRSRSRTFCVPIPQPWFRVLVALRMSPYQSFVCRDALGWECQTCNEIQTNVRWHLPVWHVAAVAVRCVGLPLAHAYASPTLVPLALNASFMFCRSVIDSFTIILVFN